LIRKDFKKMTGKKLAQLDRYDLEILNAVKELDAISINWKAVPAVAIDWRKVPKEVLEAATKFEGAITRYAYHNNWQGFLWAVKSWKEVFINWANGIAKKKEEPFTKKTCCTAPPETPACNQRSIFE